MPHPLLARIDWSRPWYAALRGAAEALGRDLPAMDLLTALNVRAAALGLCNSAGLPLSFVPQAALADGVAYETWIGAAGQVPTRDNLHDVFNALVWLSFPLIKQQLNALQASQIALSGVGRSRGAARDGATIFDENAALLVVRESAQGRALAAALRQHQWIDVLFAQRAAVMQDIDVWLFGHALMEKLAAPYKAITAHSWVVFAGDAYFSWCAVDRQVWLDAQVAQQLAAQVISTACFTPLPVLGVPGWSQAQDQAFYADTAVFRPKRAIAQASARI
jgi:hypothetical protein